MSESVPEARVPARREIRLAPSMINADWSRAGEVVAELAQLGCQWLHFDAMDGQFVPNLTLGPLFMRALRDHSDLHFDGHLMIATPGDYIPDFIKAGANSLSVHAEGNSHLYRLISQIKDGGAMAGVVLNPATPVSVLDVVLPVLDYVLVMSVNPGFSGQKFLPLALPKIAALHQRRTEQSLDFLIQVDGGISVDNAGAVVRAGADVLVSASGIFVPGQLLASTVGALHAAAASGLV